MKPIFKLNFRPAPSFEMQNTRQDRGGFREQDLGGGKL